MTPPRNVNIILDGGILRFTFPRIHPLPSVKSDLSEDKVAAEPTLS